MISDILRDRQLAADTTVEDYCFWGDREFCAYRLFNFGNRWYRWHDGNDRFVDGRQQNRIANSIRITIEDAFHIYQLEPEVCRKFGNAHCRSHWVCSCWSQTVQDGEQRKNRDVLPIRKHVVPVNRREIQVHDFVPALDGAQPNAVLITAVGRSRYATQLTSLAVDSQVWAGESELCLLKQTGDYLWLGRATDPPLNTEVGTPRVFPGSIVGGDLNRSRTSRKPRG